MKNIRLPRPDFGKLRVRAAFAAVLCVLAGARVFLDMEYRGRHGDRLSLSRARADGAVLLGCGASRALRAPCIFSFIRRCGTMRRLRCSSRFLPPIFSRSDIVLCDTERIASPAGTGNAALGDSCSGAGVRHSAESAGLFVPRADLYLTREGFIQKGKLPMLCF